MLFSSLPAQKFYTGVMDSVLPKTWDVDRSPVKLVERLTEGKDSEKEKFDAIFLWVARHIRYDYYLYNMPSGAPMPRIDMILKYKRGICLDYAYLMDSLCSLAGIKNITVLGYAKESDLFDLNDSLYMDNHAWNAVKLDNFWYVYDVTWASGSYKWDYTRFSRRLLKWRKKIWARRRESIRKVSVHARFTTECDTFEIKKSVNRRVYEFSYFDRLMWRLSHKFKLRYEVQLSEKVDLSYYLTEPELFAVTHFPDNPDWSLIARTDIRQFESDSAYYYFADSLYLYQKRGGRYCGNCDNHYSMEALAKEKNLKTKSETLNRRNRFITSQCSHNISNLLYTESLPVEDSLAKVSLMDSAIAYMSQARNDLYQSLNNVWTEMNLQKIKNREKDIVLDAENRQHLDFVRPVILRTYQETRKMDYFSKQLWNAVRTYRRMQGKIWTLAYKEIHVKEKNLKLKEKTDAMLQQLVRMHKQLDSMQHLLESRRAVYKLQLAALSKNLWNVTSLADSLNRPFIAGIFYRSVLLDNYKRPVVEVRKLIPGFKETYARNIDSLVYAPSDSCADVGTRIIDLAEERNDLAMDILRLQRELIKEHALDEGEPQVFARYMFNLIQQDICWIIGGSSGLRLVAFGYGDMVASHENTEDLIKSEIMAETWRYRRVNKIIDRRKRKFANVARHNIRVASRRLTFLTRYKRAYLKSLRDARRKEARAAKEKS